ncbi:hypothetical protein HYT26_02320 [Candidatus Pacearchaeota archaeon]|nr:hypothetical protein [Candidatus Pacearchaeota archaeon]
MSKTCVAYPIVAALRKAEELVKPVEKWRGSSLTCDRFLREFLDKCREEISKIPEIESIASWSADEINKFLRDRGFDIQLQPLNKQEFGVASVLDMLVEWKEKGEATSVIRRNTHKTYPAVRIVEKHVDFFETNKHNHPIARLRTKSSDLVYMTILENLPDSHGSFKLMEIAEELSEGDESDNLIGGVVFPMVNLNQLVDISWLKNTRTTGADGQPAIITQAVQQTKLRMNEEGARAQSAVAIGVLRGCLPKRKYDYIIDWPFLFWITRPGISKPLFVAYVTEDDWKNPGDIRSK